MTKFITIPNPSLRKRSNSVKKIDKNLIEELKKALIETKEPPGVGLSAVQIGQPVRIFVARKDTQSEPKIFINPEIVWKSKDLTSGLPGCKNKLEGCLSVPGYYGLVKRSKEIKLKYQTIRRSKLDARSSKFSGFLATVIQHEMDHINGILFIDRVLEQGNQLYKLEKEREKEILRGVEI